MAMTSPVRGAHEGCSCTPHAAGARLQNLLGLPESGSGHAASRAGCMRQYAQETVRGPPQAKKPDTTMLPINHLVFRKSICPSLLGLVGDAQMVEYIDIMANREAYPEARECPLWVKSGHSAIPGRTSAIGGKADIGEGLIRNCDPNVRYWGQSGRSRGRGSMSAYSQKRTLEPVPPFKNSHTTMQGLVHSTS
jgi:hypothetical protein